MSFIIRQAQQTDVPVLSILFSDLSGHKVTEEDVLDRLKLVKASTIDELFVYEKDGKVLGTLSFRIRENIEERSRYGEISVLIIKEEARNAGIGRTLMEFAEQHAKALNCKGTWLVSGFGREEEAHKFYKRLGYTMNGYRFVKPI
ncbi:MAG TPA: GNAT family N-acetyltransferase [Bacteroidota bacterium]|nr:GNAT family N-acetyltransferase [Bacteroidota bacterium]